MPQSKTSHEFSGATALIALAGIYGFVGYLSRELAPGLSLWQQVYLRLLLAAPFLWLTFHKHINFNTCLALVKTEPGLVMLRSFCLFVLSVPLYFYATQNAKLGNVAFLQILPYTFVLGALINKEKLNQTKILLMLLALGGAFLITIQSGLDFSHIGRGEMAGIISGALFSLGFVTRKKHKSQANDYEISLTLMTISTVIIIAMSLLTSDGIPRPEVVDTRFVVLLLVAGFVNSGMILLANYGFSRLRDTLANNIMALEGVFGLFFGYIIYTEVPVTREIAGAGIILLSAVASTYVVKKAAK